MLPYQNLSLEDMPGEIWKDIPGWNYYQVSNLGRIKSVEHINFLGKKYKNRILRQTFYGKGYLSVALYNNGKSSRQCVARIVATTFHPNVENKPTVDHIDNNKTNNNESNLRWCTYHENAINPITRARRSASTKGRRFNKNPRRGIYVYGARSIVGINPNTKEVRNYTIIKDSAKDGFDPSNVSKVCRKLIKHSGGWKFFYVDDPAIKSYLASL